MEVQRNLSHETEKTAIILPVCGLCGNVPNEGLRDGIKLKKLFICTQCENDIVNLEVGSEGYERLLERIKKTFK
ncbi:hypothetical protein SYNTR_1994 [Candidatus Syntrophocurvum alkaliphilum]|uniref:Inhibitor of sigma-G Gin n=2 Tax=Candidatus Syntrophocurvum alkaliphilum TaxID=2293317 RepID=A0A6I6DNU1_9FIRM|nr:hypothetical protein SYNTR_1994 [Candidatus Syntrophocurvum alkaliphilum]